MRLFNTLKTWLTLQCCLCVALLISSFALEHLFHLVPCVLCQLQRCVVCILCVTSLMMRLTYLKRRLFLIISAVMGVWILIGLGLAIRHIYLQYQPLGEIATHCLPSLRVMLTWLPWSTVWAQLMQGDGVCHTVSFKFLGLTLPMWLASAYAVLMILWGCLLAHKDHR